MENEIWVPMQLCIGTLNKSLILPLGPSYLICQMRLLDNHPDEMLQAPHLGQGRLLTQAQGPVLTPVPAISCLGSLPPLPTTGGYFWLGLASRAVC